MKEQYKNAESKMQKTVDSLAHEYSGLRAGRANPAILDKISIEYYGSQTPLNQVAAISVPEARTLVIQPWDAGVIKEIEKAIQASDLGINPQNDGKIVRLNFPPLTEERRRELIKQVHKYGEEAKVAIRNVRRDALDKYKDMKKKNEITEDDLKTCEKDIQTLTDKYVKEIDVVADKKEKELKEV